MRTTVDIDDVLLEELKALQRTEGKSLGRLISELLAPVVQTKRRQPAAVPFKWASQSMETRVDLSDPEAMRRAMEEG